MGILFDKLLTFIVLFGLAALIIVGGNYFLTDDVGNFSMEKAKNLMPNIEAAIVKKKNEITQTRDINTDMVSEKDAERIDIEGPVVRDVRTSVTEQYFTEMNFLENDRLTSFQKAANLENIQNKYLDQNNYWSGRVRDVKQYSDYIMMTMKIEGDDFRWNILFCQMTLNDSASLNNIKKNDKVTIIGEYVRSDSSPWLKDCEIVSTDQ